jgi:hypothetical protein
MRQNHGGFYIGPRVLFFKHWPAGYDIFQVCRQGLKNKTRSPIFVVVMD